MLVSCALTQSPHCTDWCSERARGLSKVTQQTHGRLGARTQVSCQLSPGTGLRLGHAGGWTAPTWMPTFTFPVLGIMLRQTIPRFSDSSELCGCPSPGARCPFSAQPTAHLPCDLPLPSPSTLLAPPFCRGEERRDFWWVRGPEERVPRLCPSHPESHSPVMI